MSQVTRSYIDPAALMRIKSLTLRAKAVADGFQTGIHRSPYHGFSAEFSEYRQYSAGDDPRYIDWRLYARTDRYFTKRFEDETNRRCYLLVDLSRSMQYGSGEHTKADYARTLAATLAYFLVQQRDSVGLLLFAEDIVDFHDARFRSGHLGRVIAALEQSTQGASTDLQKPLSQIARTVHRRGLIVLISDMLAEVDTLQDNLAYLRSRGHDVLVLRVLDPAELELPFDQPSMIRDLETGRDVYVEPQRARGEYQQRFQVHDDQIRVACDRLGVGYSSMLTTSPMDSALFDLIRGQMQRGQKTQRRTLGGGAR